MNDLVGAFLRAEEKGEGLLMTRQSLANAGYPIQEIEEALMESKQISEGEKVVVPSEDKKSKKSNIKIILLIIFSILLGVLAVFFIWKNLINLVLFLGR